MKNKQFVITKFSSDFKQSNEIMESEVIAPAAGQVLVKNKFVGINALYDRQLYRGAIPYIDVSFPYVFGVEAVGEVVEIGSGVTTFKKGDPVGTVKVGTAYQEFQIVKEEDLIPFPAATREYLTISPTGVSAHLATTQVCDLKAGEQVVISAAAGGLGHILVQLCKMKGCKVVAICGGTKKKNLLTRLDSCDQIIDYKAESVNDILNQNYANKIDLAIDSVGRHMFDIFLKNLADKGRLVVIGLASELPDEEFQKITAPRAYESMYWKGASIRCFMNHLYKDKHAASRAYLFDLYQKGELKIKVDETKFKGIESIAEASAYLLAGKSCGKVIVEL